MRFGRRASGLFGSVLAPLNFGFAPKRLMYSHCFVGLPCSILHCWVEFPSVTVNSGECFFDTSGTLVVVVSLRTAQTSAADLQLQIAFANAAKTGFEVQFWGLIRKNHAQCLSGLRILINAALVVQLGPEKVAHEGFEKSPVRI
jgi:hypothetical protein